MADLNNDIQLARRLVETTPLGQQDRWFRLSGLAAKLYQRYRNTDEIADLEEAITLMQVAVEIIPYNHPSRAQRLNWLGILLGDRYRRKGILTDLELTVQLQREAVSTTASDDPDLPARLSDFAAALGGRYRQNPSRADLEEMIQILDQVRRTAPDKSSGMAIILSNLGLALYHRYVDAGNVDDMNEGIQTMRKAVDLIPLNHADRPSLLSNLATGLDGRYQRMGAAADLDEAIVLMRNAVGIASDKHADRGLLLSNLAAFLGSRFHRTGATTNKDLNEAITIAREAVEATPPNHIDQVERLSSLGIHLNDRHQQSGATATTDLEEAIRVTQEAIKIAHPDYVQLALLYASLGVYLGSKYKLLGAASTKVSDEAVQALQVSLRLNPVDHPARAKLLSDLGAIFIDRYLHTQDMADIEEALVHVKSAFHHTNSSITDRFKAGRQVIVIYTFTMRWKEAYKASQEVISLVPKLTHRSLEVTDMQFRLSAIANLACDAVAMGLGLQATPVTALSLLEEGRGVLATSIGDKRTDVSHLQDSYPNLAAQFSYFCKKLEPSVAAKEYALETHTSSHQQDSVFLRSQADNRLDELIAEIRQKHGFETFLLASSESEMCAAAGNGAIVVINVSDYRSDALIIERDGIRCIELIDLDTDDVCEMVNSNSLATNRVLEWLWDVVTKPVLNSLGFTSAPLNNRWPHVWWVPTGPLTMFPIHAAGYHTSNTNETVIDRVMSSYSTTVKAIVQGRRPHSTKPVSLGSQAVLVAMQDTPDHLVKLNSANKELEVVRDACQSLGMTIMEPRHYKNDVTLHLPNCSVFHFAGHGYTYGADPSRSYLALNDWKTDPLTVANLLELSFRESSPFLAYLSACGTSRVKNEKYFDESIHLVGAFQLAGFRHVIGTLWEVNDETCVEMAKMTYEGIRDDGMTDESVCLGLHMATRELRKRWKSTSLLTRRGRHANRDIDIRVLHDGVAATDSTTDQTREGEKLARDIIAVDEDDETESLQWVPYVHFGV